VEADGVREGPGADALHRAAPDVLVVVAYGHLLPREILELPTYGAINLHFSLLPRWRGAAPVAHALLAGDVTTGITVMRMDEGLDTGPVLAQMEEEVRPDDDAGTLGARLATLGARSLVGVLRTIAVDAPPERPQDPTGVTLAPRISPEDRVLDWGSEPEDIVRRIRALAPEPGATTSFRAEPLKILAAGLSHEGLRRDHDAAQAGTIIEADERGVLVATANGGVRLIEVAPAGRARMSAADWARGARFGSGERLG
jgi:methionyl-tRNA formyltransferase